MVKRKLVTIQKITELKPIEGADAIECATVLGWHVVVKKGEFKVNDSCCYFEIDSLLPQIAEFDFLSKQGTKTSYADGKEYIGYRLKTVRLRGQVSQGLCLPLSILNGKKFSTDTRESTDYDFKEGMEVTKLLGVVKYESKLPANLSGLAIGLFPSGIPKTDEMRLQAFPKVLERHKDKIFYMAEKLDGASCTLFIKEDKLNVCSRNLNLAETESNTFWKVARAIDIEGKLKSLMKDKGKNIALQGELIGDNVQENRLKLNGHTIYYFSAYDIDMATYLNYGDFVGICKELELPTVPILSESFKLKDNVDEMVSMVNDLKSKLNPNALMEGIVFRPLIEATDADLGRLSFKVINPAYLLKYGE